ncbi:MAG TPA: LacI family DNA-binding transcriptional regulator [Gemmatimonadaceae bacterium]|nr:LacI family DNA-binding transcriptional regulator [Gemmatimonadaceae bacterium]
MTGPRSTISDVATHAGVSKATVSAVLNGTGTVKQTTRDRVLAAAEALNYRPIHSGHRAAVARRDRCIALLIKEHDNPYYAAIIDGARACVASAGYTLLVVSTAGEYESERRAVEVLRAKDVDGLIVTPVLDEHADLGHYFELRRRNIPFVLLEEVRGLPASLVDVNNVEASRRAVEHLIALGHSRIVHFAGPAYSAHSRQRVDGVRHAYSGSRLVFGDDAVVPAGAHMEDGYRAALALFRSGGRRGAEARATAVTCYNDLVAVGVYRALRELGLRVPDDVSVVGFDDIPLCEYLACPLTTVRVPKFEMGETAARMLVEQIEAAEAIPPKKVFVDATLVVRASTAPPPGVAATAAALAKSSPSSARATTAASSSPSHKSGSR